MTNGKIPIPRTDRAVKEIKLSAASGIKREGTITIIDGSGHQEKFNWRGQYRGENRWKIEGDGARIGSGNTRAPDTERFPFVLEPLVNAGMITNIIEWLNRQLSNAPTNSAAVPTAAVVPEPLKPAPSPVPAAVIVLPVVPLTTSPGAALLIRVDECVPFQPNFLDPKFSGQPRKYFDQARLQKLGLSMKKHGQRQAIKVMPLSGVPGKKWEITDGERRWRAAQMMGIEHLKAVVEKVLDKRAQHLDSLILNFNKQEHTPLELSNALQEQIDAGETPQSLADAISKHYITVLGLLSLQKLHPELKPLLDPPTPEKDRITIDHGKILSKFPLDRQVGEWNKSKGEKTKALVRSKLLVSYRSIAPSQRRKERSLSPNQIAERVERRFTRLVLTLAELDMVSPEEWQCYCRFNGPMVTGTTVSKLGEVITKVKTVQGHLNEMVTVKPPKAVAA